MESLDPSVLALTKAIGQTESGGNYNAVGDNGNSHGAYQFQKGTWQDYAKDVLGDASAPMTTENQNKVAYGKVKAWKDQGYTPAQIASKWNSGGFDTYKKGDAAIGTNKAQGVDFNVPAYVAKVSQAFRQNIGQPAGAATAQAQGYNPKPFSSGAIDFSGLAKQPDVSEQTDTLGSEINARTQDFTGALSSVVGGKQATGTSRISGLLQAGGAVGGAIGDVTNKALELIPGVKGLENLIGKGIGSLAKTPMGQSVSSAIQSFSQQHPELAKDIGAGFNIATAIPIVKGLGAVGSLAKDATATALKGVVEKSFQNDLESAAARTVGGRKILSSIPDIAKTIVDERAIPSMSGGKFSTKEASAILEKKINDIDKNELQAELAKANTSSIADRTPIESVRQAAIKDAEENLIDPSGIDKTFDLIRKKYGDFPSLQQLNEAKRTVAKRISEAAFGSPEATANKLVRSSLQTAVEDGAQKMGLADVGEINQRMRKLINAQKLLDVYVNDRKPGEGFFGKVIKNIPIVGNPSEDTVKSIIGNAKAGLLKSTGKNAVRTSIKGAAKKAGIMAAVSVGKKGLLQQQ
jgi:hypothetical protein